MDMVFLGGVVGGVGLRIVPKPRIAITGLHMRLPWVATRVRNTLGGDSVSGS